MKNNKHRLEHFGADDKLPNDSEYYDSEYASIDRVLYIRDVNNSEGHSYADFENKSLYEQVQLTLESPLLSYFYTPYRIYLMQSYMKAMKEVNERRETLKQSEGDVTEELQQCDELEKQYELLLPELVHLPSVQKVVLVKWNNQTYDQVTWELESDIRHEQSKIITFHRNNRMPDMSSVAPFTYFLDSLVT